MQIVQELLDEPEKATVAIADHESDEIVKNDVEIQVNLAPIVKDAQTQIAPKRKHIGVQIDNYTILR